MTVCRIRDKFERIECPREAWEGDPDGFCLLHSRKENKDEDGKFTDVVKQKLDAKDYDFCMVFFPGGVNFRGHKFRKKADFWGATFKIADFSGASFKNVNFSRATFQEANFSGATFHKAYFFTCAFHKAYFLSATFHKADFSWATFQEVLFNGATFQEVAFNKATFQKGEFFKATFHEASFQWTSFQEGDFIESTFHKARFCGATFQKVNFRWTIFHEAFFTGAKTNGRMTLEGIRSGEPLKENHPWSADLRSIRFGEKGVLNLENLSLARAQFTGTDLRRVEFDRVIWASWCWRAAVYDEVLLHQRRWAHIAYVLKYGGFWWKSNPDEVGKGELGKPSSADFAPVERLYRLLKINYEEERDFKRVGDFHYGEMEMHRRGSFWRQWVPFSWHNLYRVLSGYGERPLRAFIWLLLLIPAWAGLVWGLGIDQAGSQNPINYWDTLLFIFEKATLQRPPWPTDIKNINWLGKLLASLSVLLLPGQAALFILALRNRLGRRR